jgi:hypothetical protein
LEHECLFGFSFKGVYPLLIFRRAERNDRKGLGLTADKKCRSMSPGKDPDIRTDRTYFIGLPSVHPYALIENHVPDKVLLNLFKT